MIYADYNGSAPLAPEVKEYLANRIESGPFANPNSIHCLGEKLNYGMEKCRKICAKVLGCQPEQIIFNSGASEGISTVFHSVLENNNKKIIIVSALEHSAVINSAKYYESKGFELRICPADKNGHVDINQILEWIKNDANDIALVSIMAANNETGIIQPWGLISDSCQKHEIPYFSDTTQYIGKTEFDFENSGMDYAVLSGHKIGALIGTGLLIAKDPTTVKPIVFGGGQENGHRGGTQNYLGVETIAVALQDFENNKEKLNNVKRWREEFERNISELHPNVEIIGRDSKRLAGTTMIGYPGIHGQAVVIELEAQDIFVSTSSACSDNEPATSKVLKSMGVDDILGRSVIRISLGTHASNEDYSTILENLNKAYNKLTKVNMN